MITSTRCVCVLLNYSQIQTQTWIYSNMDTYMERVWEKEKALYFNMD